MPELDTRSLLDGGDPWEGHTLLCPECEDAFDYVHPVRVDVDADGVGFATARVARAA